MDVLTMREEIILGALLMLGGSSHGSPIRGKVNDITGREIVYGTLYNLLEILIRKGYVISRRSNPQPVQGGRSKAIYSITRQGRLALKETMAMHEAIKNQLPEFEPGR